MYVVASDSGRISPVSGCFYCCNWLTKKDAGLPSGDKFSQHDHIFVGLGPKVHREGHTLTSRQLRVHHVKNYNSHCIFEYSPENMFGYFSVHSMLVIQVARLLKCATSPAVDEVKLELKVPSGVSFSLIPTEMPAIYMGEHFIAYALLTGTSKVSVN